MPYVPSPDPSERPQLAPDDSRVFVSFNEAKHLLGVGESTMRRLLNSGVIESRYVGARRLVVLESVRSAVDALPSERVS